MTFHYPIQHLRDIFSSDKVTILAIRMQNTLTESRNCPDSIVRLFLLGQAVAGIAEMAEIITLTQRGQKNLVELLAKYRSNPDEHLLLVNVLQSLRAHLDALETGAPSTICPPIDTLVATELLNKVLQELLKEHRSKTGYLWKHGLLRLCVFTITGASLCAVICASYFVWKNLQTQGLRVTYYKGENFEHKMGFNTEYALVKDYGRGAPLWWMTKNHFSSRWEGWLLVPISANYEFYSQSDEGIRLKIDGTTVIDNWHGHSWETSGCHGNIILDRGPHQIVAEHYNSSGPAALRVRWCGGPIPPNTVISAPFLSTVRRDPRPEQALQ